MTRNAPINTILTSRARRGLVLARRAAGAALVLLLAAAAAPGLATEPARPAPAPAQRAVATFAMGCFWCAEDAFEGHAGVLSVVSGYTGGKEKNPTYEQVSAHRTGHLEAIEVTYDPSKVSYEALLDVFWHNVDPGDGGGQFCDRGEQYRSAIFVHDEAQRQAAVASAQKVAAKVGKVATLVVAASPFYAAEGYHQDYATKNPLRYGFYRTGCGRDARLRRVWGDQAGHH
jgi:peptide-methionine (S)-S-oxide reductase